MKIYPSMLSANPCCMGDELRELSDADGIHWDIMDGSFVDKITFGADVIKAHREITSQIFDVHLMINNPDKHIKVLAEAGADIITVHAETTSHLHNTLSKIKGLGVKAGVAINPSTSIDFIQYVVDVIDVVLVMTVNPGQAGQHFIPLQLNKIRKLSQIISNNIEICVDGGINDQNIHDCVLAGATTFVAGSFVFKQSDYSQAIRNLREAATY